jgi:hypothetical protein
VSARHPHDVEFVHELRKTIKRMRALARLLRHELGRSGLQESNDSLRAAAQRLAGERDAQVRLSTLERLRKRHPKALDLPAVELLRTRLEGERERASSPASDRQLLTDIRAMRGRLRRWSELDLEREMLARGLRRIYAQGRRRYRRAAKGRPDSRELHDWRKRVKNLHYALQMVEAEQTAARDLVQAADRLGDILGEEHDLWMLASYVKQRRHTSDLQSTELEQLSKQIERRRRRLRKRALTLGEKVYELEPDDFLGLFQS